MRTLVVLPTFNEAANVATVLRRVRSVLPDADVLVVDDDSPDGTADLAEAAGRELGRVEVLRRRGPRGLGPAYREGLGLGLDRGYDTLVEMDADLSHDPSLLPALLRPLADRDGDVDRDADPGADPGADRDAGARADPDAGARADPGADRVAGADLVIGSRYIPGGAIPDWPVWRRTLSRAGNRYASAVLRLPVTDATSGYRAFRATVLHRIELESVGADGYGFQIEMVYRVVRLGGRVVEVPIEFVDRTQGSSKMSSRIVVEALVLVTWWGVRDRLRDRCSRLGRRR